MKMTNKKELINRLKSEHDSIVEAKQNDVCLKRAYVNLPITLLERTFFELVSAKLHLDQTKMLKRFIGALMKRHPELIEEAKQRIYEEEKTNKSKR